MDGTCTDCLDHIPPLLSVFSAALDLRRNNCLDHTDCHEVSSAKRARAPARAVIILLDLSGIATSIFLDVRCNYYHVLTRSSTSAFREGDRREAEQ